MSLKTRNVITTALLAAGMLVAMPTIAKTSAPQEIKVKTTVGGYMDWSRVDGTAISDPIQLQYVANGGHGEFKNLKLNTKVTPEMAGKKVSFLLKNDLEIVNQIDQSKIDGFKISVGGVELKTAGNVTVVAEGESGFTGVSKALLVTHSGLTSKPADGRYVGFASIVLEGEA
ncbi:fimbrial protein [Photobacterium profundum]|uniref:CS1 type fimbrial major subunit n=1 Tax=Photobacterium profundum (strain SS9) TaxID=298386 RepID=Q6LFV5_PHOPR|nr:fimbrial protein [Photobacterium profundum]CAG23825.1 hypothetical protein PBPRB1980 [Photobacterium profundum SS9]